MTAPIPNFLAAPVPVASKPVPAGDEANATSVDFATIFTKTGDISQSPTDDDQSEGLPENAVDGPDQIEAEEDEIIIENSDLEGIILGETDPDKISFDNDETEDVAVYASPLVLITPNMPQPAKTAGAQSANPTSDTTELLAISDGKMPSLAAANQVILPTDSPEQGSDPQISKSVPDPLPLQKDMRTSAPVFAKANTLAKQIAGPGPITQALDAETPVPDDKANPVQVTPSPRLPRIDPVKPSPSAATTATPPMSASAAQIVRSLGEQSLRQQIEAAQKPRAPLRQSEINPTVAPNTVVASPVVAAFAPLLAREIPKADQIANVEESMSLPLGSMAVSGSGHVAAPAQTIMTIETARHVASQLAVGVSKTGRDTTEVFLNPAELGRVRLKLSAHDTSIILIVQAERPETAEFMRRHIDVLAQEFRALGYGNIKFEFGQSQGGQPQANNQNQGTSQGRSAAPDSSLPMPDRPLPQAHATTGLDLRL